VAGTGGEISDDPEEPRQEQTYLRYLRWEVEYRLKVLQEVTKDNQLVLLLTTPPRGPWRRGTVPRAWGQSFGSEWLGFGTREGLAQVCAGSDRDRGCAGAYSSRSRSRSKRWLMRWRIVLSRAREKAV
jgi:hypothetical protein